MNAIREAMIARCRRQQGEAELERKWKKAQGRWSNRYWAQEWLDLVDVRAEKMMKKLRELPES